MRQSARSVSYTHLEVENKVRAHYNLPLKDAEPTALAESGDDAE